MTQFPHFGLRLQVPPPPIDPATLEQWETLCSVATPTGLCAERAIDPEDPVRICQMHTSVVIGQALRRLDKQLAAAQAEDEKRAREAEEASHADESQAEGTGPERSPGVPGIDPGL